ncbi:hypothetical protein HAZT_HAZT007157 [Hyalella azteca]|uniref:Saposin B-type domain-containing protein n=1 Tax=Hyalella azteca TaxID=294128 RepID=A0A6A0H7S6_HYAAZ|nr:hypothetical protein HAZT_HAZT007157 [Hyalella azteca]
MSIVEIILPTRIRIGDWSLRSQAPWNHGVHLRASLLVRLSQVTQYNLFVHLQLLHLDYRQASSIFFVHLHLHDRNAKQCSAVKHCIQTVWETQKLPADNDDICGICKDMVEQARDTLQSNQTQEELKEVLEGSCHLIPLKEVAVECVELADEFIPELIETLASQMNPQVVCATAGLCNSVRVDRLLRERSPPSGNSAPGNPAPGNSAPGNSAPGNSATEIASH